MKIVEDKRQHIKNCAETMIDEQKENAVENPKEDDKLKGNTEKTSMVDQEMKNQEQDE